MMLWFSSCINLKPERLLEFVSMTYVLWCTKGETLLIHGQYTCVLGAWLMDGEIKIHRYGIYSYLNDSTCYRLKGIIQGLKDSITRS